MGVEEIFGDWGALRWINTALSCSLELDHAYHITNMLTVLKNSTSTTRLLVPGCLRCQRLLSLSQAHSPLPLSPSQSHSPAHYQGCPGPSLRYSRSGIRLRSRFPISHGICPRQRCSICRLSILCVSIALAVGEKTIDALRCTGGGETVDHLDGRVARIAIPSLRSLLDFSKCIHLDSLQLRRQFLLVFGGQEG